MTRLGSSDQPTGIAILLHDATDRVEALAAADAARREAERSALLSATLAATLQESLLPPSLPTVAGASIAARFRPAGDGAQVGGDFYDVFETAPTESWIAVGDVAGKGAGAARLTALARYSLRSIVHRPAPVERHLEELNEIVLQQYELDRDRGDQRYLTVVLARCQRSTTGMTVTVASGGHPPALVLRHDGTVEEVPARGPIIGILPSVSFVPAEVHLGRHDALVVVTDGVTEARSTAGQLGEDRLRRLLGDLVGRSADEIAEDIATTALAFQGGHARDDIAVVVLRAE